MIDEERKAKAGALALCLFNCPQNYDGGICYNRCYAADHTRVYAASIFRRYENMAKAVLKAADDVSS